MTLALDGLWTDIHALDGGWRHNSNALAGAKRRIVKLKESSVGDPDLYLGVKLRRIEIPNGGVAWGVSPSKYVQEAVRNVKII